MNPVLIYQNYVITSYSIHYTKLYECELPCAMLILLLDEVDMVKRLGVKQVIVGTVFFIAVAIFFTSFTATNPILYQSSAIILLTLVVITSYSIHYTKLYELAADIK